MRPLAEISAVVAAAIVHFVLTRVVGVRGLDILPLTACVFAYLLVRGRSSEVRADWGTRLAGFQDCVVDATPLFATGVLACLLIGWQRGHLACDGHLLVTLLLYPLWGIAQQFLVLALLAHNLDLIGWSRSVVFGTSVCAFSLVHAPNWQQVAATFVLGAWCTRLFFRHRNLWPLGIAHGVLGALFYRWVLGVDVVEAMFTLR